MADIKKLFGQRIKEYRKSKHYTQAHLAEMVNVDDKHISCIESGKNFPSPDLIGRLANALNIEPKNLFEFYHLQEEADIKADIISSLNSLKKEELGLVLKYIRNFII